ncbi:methyltransferase domain-containing protein [Spirillospora sp. NPDC029432]|uniref:class I SAM-dependent methyltransferase n=1 Tax=Spirillospora sp. NPDC029432 TaxID=3154599 RepID=UPI003452DFDA
MGVDQGQAEAWNGYEGRHWAEHYERYDAVNGGFNGYVLDGAGIGERDRVLDIGCGNGQLTRLAAGRGQEAVGVDLSGPMLARARERAGAENVSNVAFEQGDVQVHPFREGEFDVAISRFGVMFFADPVEAFGNVHRALGPGGRLSFVCMTRLDGTDLGSVFEAMAEFLPMPTGPDGTGPTSLADPDRTARILGEAGFRDVECAHVEADQVWGRDLDDAAAFLADWGPVHYHLGLVGPEQAAKARAALVDGLRPFAGERGVRARGTAWLVTARR